MSARSVFLCAIIPILPIPNNNEQDSESTTHPQDSTFAQTPADLRAMHVAESVEDLDAQGPCQHQTSHATHERSRSAATDSAYRHRGRDLLPLRTLAQRSAIHLLGLIERSSGSKICDVTVGNRTPHVTTGD